MVVVTEDFCKVLRSSIMNAIANAIGRRKEWDPMRGTIKSLVGQDQTRRKTPCCYHSPSESSEAADENLGMRLSCVRRASSSIQLSSFSANLRCLRDKMCCKEEENS